MPRPRLIVVGGSLATGKSTITAALAAHLGLRRVAMDHIKESLFDLGGFRDRAWSKEIGRIAFDVFRHMIELHLRFGESVIAESTFIWPSDADWLHEFAKKYNAELVQIWLTADPKVARERFLARARSGERHPGHCDTVETVLAEFDERYFSKTFQPLSLHGRTLVVSTTNFDAVDHDAIAHFIERSA